MRIIYRKLRRHKVDMNKKTAPGFQNESESLGIKHKNYLKFFRASSMDFTSFFSIFMLHAPFLNTA